MKKSQPCSQAVGDILNLRELDLLDSFDMARMTIQLQVIVVLDRAALFLGQKLYLEPSQRVHVW